MAEFYPPFFEDEIGDNIGEGAESKVFEFGENFVLKEPNDTGFAERILKNIEPVDEEDSKKVQQLIEYMASEEHFRHSKEDYDRLKTIFGDMLVDTTYVIGEPRQGNSTGHYIFQNRIEGKTWHDFSTKLNDERREKFLNEHKDEFITLVGGARKVLIETGGLMDLWSENVFVDQGGNRERLAIIDPGTPTELNRFLDGKLPVPKQLQLEMTKRIQKMVKDLDQYKENLGLSADEEIEMNNRFEMTEQEYENAKRILAEKCEKLLK